VCSRRRPKDTSVLMSVREYEDTVEY
jgi:hypothetical protein